MGIRAGALPDSTLVARGLMDVKLAMIASARYLENHGEPLIIDDLKNHNCLIDTVPGYAGHWPLFDGKKTRTIVVGGNMRVNSGEIVRTLTLAGHGIALIPRYMAVNELKSGELVSLFEDAIRFEAGLYAVYPQRRFVSATIRTFIAYLIAHFDQLKLRYETIQSMKGQGH